MSKCCINIYIYIYVYIYISTKQYNILCEKDGIGRSLYFSNMEKVLYSEKIRKEIKWFMSILV